MVCPTCYGNCYHGRCWKCNKPKRIYPYEPTRPLPAETDPVAFIVLGGIAIFIFNGILYLLFGVSLL